MTGRSIIKERSKGKSRKAHSVSVTFRWTYLGNYLTTYYKTSTKRSLNKNDTMTIMSLEIRQILMIMPYYFLTLNQVVKETSFTTILNRFLFVPLFVFVIKHHTLQLDVNNCDNNSKSLTNPVVRDCSWKVSRTTITFIVRHDVIFYYLETSPFRNGKPIVLHSGETNVYP